MYHYLNKIEDIKISNTSFSNHEFYKGNTIDFLYKYDDEKVDNLRLIYKLKPIDLISEYYNNKNYTNTKYDYKIYFIPAFKSINTQLVKLFHSEINKISQKKCGDIIEVANILINKCKFYNQTNNKYIQYLNLTTDIFDEIKKDKEISLILNIKLDFHTDNWYKIIFDIDSVIIHNAEIFSDNCIVNNINYNFYGKDIELETIDFTNSLYYYNKSISLEDNIIKLLKYNNIDYQINPIEYNKIVINYYENITLKYLNILIDFKKFYNISDFITSKLKLLKDITIHFSMGCISKDLICIKINNEFKIFEKIKNKEYLFNIVLNPFNFKDENNNLLNDYYNMIFILIRNIILKLKEIENGFNQYNETEKNTVINLGLNTSSKQSINPELNTELNTELNPELNTELNPELNTSSKQSINPELNTELNISSNQSINLELNTKSSNISSNNFLNQTILGNNYEGKSYNNITEDNLIKAFNYTYLINDYNPDIFSNIIMFRNKNIFYIKDSKYINIFNNILNKLDKIHIRNVFNTFKYVEDTIDFNKIYINWFDKDKTINYLYNNNDEIELNKLVLKINVSNVSIYRASRGDGRQYINYEKTFDFDKIKNRIKSLIDLKPTIKYYEVFLYEFNCPLHNECIILLEYKNKLIEMKNIYTDLFNKLIKNNQVEVFYTFNIKNNNRNYYDEEEYIIDSNMVGIKIKYENKLKIDNLTNKNIIYKKSENEYFGEIDGYIDCNSSICIYNSDNEIDEQINSILKYYKIKTINTDKYNIKVCKYYNGIRTGFNNFIINFDDRFKGFDISKTIKEGLERMNEIEAMDIRTDIKIIEKQKNKEYVFMYNFNPFGMYYVYFDEYYKEIRDLLIYICDVKNYKYKLSESEINKNYPNNQYKILNDNYIIDYYKQYPIIILKKAFYNVFENSGYNMECYKGIIMFLNGTVCFLNKNYKQNFDKYLKKDDEDENSDNED